MTKILLEQIIPRCGVIERIDSDTGTHFTSKILQTVCAALDTNWNFHTPWYPQSLGCVERMNTTLKTPITKLIIETKLPWTKCLPLESLRIRTAPRKHMGVSPYEVLLGLPYLGREERLPVPETNGLYLQNYLQAIMLSFADLRKKGLLPQTSPLDIYIHQVKLGDWVLIKSWKNDTLTLTWEGPFQIRLTVETAVHTTDRGWSHAT